MKTNKLMTAFALSAMFAACTQDAELNETIAKNDLSNIPMVEAEFTADFGVESRMASQFNWEEGDLVGLAWTGKTSGTSTGEAWANYPLKCINPSTKAFKGESMYYVGNYFAYLPYSEETTDVAYIPFSIKEQPLTTNANELASKMIYITPQTIALTTETAGRGKNFALQLSRLTNTVTLNLEFKNATSDLKVTKVELALADKHAGGTSKLPVGFTYKPNPATTQTEWKDVKSNTFYTNHVRAINKGNIVLSNEDGLSLNADGKLTVYAVAIPVFEAIQIAGFDVIVTTNKGVVTVSDAKAGKENNVTKAVKLSDASLSAPLFTEFAQSGAVFATVDMKNAAGIDTEAADQAELESIIADWITMGKAKEDLAVTLKPATANDDKTFELTDFAIPADYEGTLTLTADGTNAKTIVFNGTTTIDKRLVLGSATVVKGNMTVNYVENIANTLTKGAGTFGLTVDNGATLVNNGVIGIQVATVAADEDEGLAAGKYVHNGEKAALTQKLDNQGEAQWIAGASNAPSVVSNTNFVYAEVLTFEDIKAANDAMVYEIHLMNGARIVNNTEEAISDFAWVVKCYGNVTINVTDSYNSSTPQTLNIASVQNSGLYVTEGAYVVITSDNAQNVVNAGSKVYVEENATLSVNNVIYNATVVSNEGSVVTYNTTGFTK